jgi:hypothetical protein
VTATRSGGGGNNSGHIARVFVGVIRYRCRDSCLTTVNRQFGQVGNDVADVIGITVTTARICGNKNPGGSVMGLFFGGVGP